MTGSIYNVEFKGQGFKFSVIEILGGYKTEYQAVISNDSMGWTKNVGYQSEDYLEAWKELKYFYKLGFNFEGVIYNPAREVNYQ